MVQEILRDLNLIDDSNLARALAEINIELDGTSVEYQSINKQAASLIAEIHADNMAIKLETIVQSALGYYALPDQPEGTNEAPIGPRFAQQLIRKIRNRTINIVGVKDALHSRLQTGST